MHAAARDGEPFELVVLDGQMPGMDGIELAQAIQLAPSLRAARLIMLTSATDRRADARAAGIEHYLQKPVRRARLLETVAGAMGAAQHRPHVARSTVASGDGAILVVEDNAVNQAVIQAMLTKRGYSVECAGNGREALSMLAVHSYALVFMDCQMPEMDGYAATAAIRARETRYDAAADRRHDRPRHEGRPRALPGRGHGRLPVQAPAPGRARRGARAHPRRRGPGGVASRSSRTRSRRSSTTRACGSSRPTIPRSSTS